MCPQFLKYVFICICISSHMSGVSSFKWSYFAGAEDSTPEPTPETEYPTTLEPGTEDNNAKDYDFASNVTFPDNISTTTTTEKPTPTPTITTIIPDKTTRTTLFNRLSTTTVPSKTTIELFEASTQEEEISALSRDYNEYDESTTEEKIITSPQTSTSTSTTTTTSTSTEASTTTTDSWSSSTEFEDEELTTISTTSEATKADTTTKIIESTTTQSFRGNRDVSNSTVSFIESVSSSESDLDSAEPTVPQLQGNETASPNITVVENPKSEANGTEFDSNDSLSNEEDSIARGKDQRDLHDDSEYESPLTTTTTNSTIKDVTLSDITTTTTTTSTTTTTDLTMEASDSIAKRVNTNTASSIRSNQFLSLLFLTLLITQISF